MELILDLICNLWRVLSVLWKIALKITPTYIVFKPLKLLPPFLESPRQRPCSSGQGLSVDEGRRSPAGVSSDPK